MPLDKSSSIFLRQMGAINYEFFSFTIQDIQIQSPMNLFMTSLCKHIIHGGLLIGHREKVKFHRILRDKFVEKMADFAGNLQKCLA